MPNNPMPNKTNPFRSDRVGFWPSVCITRGTSNDPTKLEAKQLPVELGVGVVSIRENKGQYAKPLKTHMRVNVLGHADPWHVYFEAFEDTGHPCLCIFYFGQI